jgi:predicted N-acetyltransferase YhbS
MQLPEIRPMTAADVDEASAAVLRSGWGDRRVKLAWVAGHAACRAFVAEAGGVIVGTGVTTVNGPVGWIGTIWVEPAWRGRGLGRALTLATIEAAEAAGCSTLVLVATAAGQPLYERLGFRIQTQYRIVETPGLGGGDHGGVPRVRSFHETDLPAILGLDAAATGEDRAHVLTDFAAPDTTRCVERPDGSIGGFIVRAPWGGGATVAPDPDDALAILHARRLASTPDRRVRAGLLAVNTAGLERLLADGWVDAWHAPRMIRGEMPAWQPAAIWGQFDHAIG